jgi:hypothetical protein
LCFFAAMTVITSCNITGTEYYSPAFTVINDSIYSNIKNITDFEQVEMRAARTKNAEGEIIKVGIEIDITLIKDAAAGNDEQARELSRQIALLVKTRLKTPGEFSFYAINFLTPQGTDPLSKKKSVKSIILQSAAL